MADNYSVQASNRTVLVRSPQLVEDVEELHVITKPSGVTFVRDVLYTTWKSGKWRADVEQIAAHIEHILSSRPHVIGGSAVQNVGTNGLLSNGVEFIVSYDGAGSGNPGPFRASVTIPVQVLHDQDTFDAYFDDVVKALAATAAG